MLGIHKKKRKKEKKSDSGANTGSLLTLLETGMSISPGNELIKLKLGRIMGKLTDSPENVGI